MIRRTVALLTLLILVLPAASVWPLGVGNIELRSNLNEPLVAHIPLRSLESGDLEGMRVTLGSLEQFERAGVDRPFFLTQLRFTVTPSGDGARIDVSSKEAITEPFINFLVEVNWPRGRVIREYTVLLDPPVYGAAINSTVRQSVPTVTREPPMQAAEPVAVPAPTSSSPTAAAPARPASTTPGGTYGPVTETDTLWSLAERFRPDSAYSVQQTMLAILKANPDAFSQNNVNTLRAGALLRIPSTADVAGMSKAAALDEVRRQHAQWQEIRAGLGRAAVPPAPEAGMAGSAPESGATAGTPSSTGAASDTAASTAAAQPRLELVGAGSDAAGAVGAPGEAGNVEELRRELNLALEEVEASRRQGQELGERLTDAEALIDDLRRLVELKDESIAALQERLAAGETATPAPAVPPAPLPEAPVPIVEAPAPVPAATPAPEPPPAEPTATEPVAQTPAPAPEKPKVPLPPPPAPEPTSFFDILTDVLPVDPLLLAGGLGGLVVIGLVVALLRRRRKGSEEASADMSAADDEPDIGSLIDQYSRTEVPDHDDSPTEMPTEVGGDTVVGDDEDRTEISETTRPAPPREAPHREEEDPLAEVNNYLAYEHFDQAEDLVRRAIEQYPERHEYKVRLLDVLRQAGNAASFAAVATTLRDLVGTDSPHVQKVTDWWAEIAPGSKPFEVDGAAVAEEDFSQTHVGMQRDDGIFDVTGTGGTGGSVDFDLGFEMTGGEDTGGDTTELESTAKLSDDEFDFETGSTDDEQPAAEGTGSDLDFMLDDGGTADQGIEAPTSSTGLDFDLGFGDEPETAADAGSLEAADDGELDFDLGDDVTVERDAAELDGTEEIDFDLGDTAGGAESKSADGDQTEEMDFDLGDVTPTTSEDEPDAGTAVAPAQDDDLGLDLDLDVDSMQASAADEEAELRPGMDDVTQEGAAATPAGDDDILDFDLGDDTATAEPVADAGAADDLDLDFSLDGEVGEAPLGGEDDELGFDLDLGADEDVKKPVTEAGTGSDSDEAAGDTVLDVNFGADADSLRAGDEASDDLDFDLGGLGDDSGATAGSAADELDFDLGSMDDESTETASTHELQVGDGGDDQLLDDGESLDTVRLNPDDLPQTEGDGDDLLTMLDGVEADESVGGSDSNILEQAVDKDDGELDFDLGDGADFGADFDFELDEEGGSDGLGMDGDSQGTDDKTLVLGRGAGGELDEVQTKLDLAQAYIDMGDTENARAILGEVMAEGSDAQKDEAQQLLAKVD